MFELFVGFLLCGQSLIIVFTLLQISQSNKALESFKRKVEASFHDIRKTQEVVCADIEFAVGSAQEVIKLTKELREKLTITKTETIN